MKKVLQMAKPVSIVMTVLMLLMSLPCQAVFAGMVETEMLMEAEQGEAARSYVRQILDRKEIKDAFVAQGIDPEEANSRIDSLTDAEVIRLAQQIDQLPAGGSALGIIVGASLIVFLVLLFTDIMGYTNIFPFVS